MNNLQNQDYRKWIAELKQKVYSTQIKASIAVNSALIEFYWDLGKMIAEKENVWGSKLIEHVAIDLKSEFPEMKGFSVSNLKYCKNFYLFYSKSISQQAVDQFQNAAIQQYGNDGEIVRQPDGFISQQLFFQIPWGHNILIFTKSKNITEALFYLNQTNENNWHC